MFSVKSLFHMHDKLFEIPVIFNKLFAFKQPASEVQTLLEYTRKQKEFLIWGLCACLLILDIHSHPVALQKKIYCASMETGEEGVFYTPVLSLLG